MVSSMLLNSVKVNKLYLQATFWMNLRNMMSKRSHTQNTIWFLYSSDVSKTTTTSDSSCRVQESLATPPASSEVPKSSLLIIYWKGSQNSLKLLCSWSQLISTKVYKLNWPKEQTLTGRTFHIGLEINPRNLRQRLDPSG